MKIDPDRYHPCKRCESDPERCKGCGNWKSWFRVIWRQIQDFFDVEVK